VVVNGLMSVRPDSEVNPTHTSTAPVVKTP
jgi:hypothetical protein